MINLFKKKIYIQTSGSSGLTLLWQKVENFKELVKIGNVAVLRFLLI